MSYYRRFRRKSLLMPVCIIGFLYLCIRLLFGRVLPQPRARRVIQGPIDWNSPPCAQLEGANDTLVVLRTGATELKDKLPVHFHTTLLCYPHYLLFSDLEETLEGHHILDALDFVNPEVKATNDDFEIWRRLQKQGRAALAADELSGPESRVSPMTGKGSNPGWKLDKWKFLPMVNRTLNEYPDMKWYIFVETDTYMFWSTALAWIATLDHTRPWYMGSQMQIGDVIFGHGGSGFIASHAAMRLVVDLFLDNQGWWESYTNGHWAGDCVLGRAFKESGAPLAWAWPTIQGVKPGAIGYERFEYGKRLWCHPTMSYHHLSPPEVEDIWRFEQQWLVTEEDIVRHSDVFKSYIYPRIQGTQGTKVEWDNLSGNFEEAAEAGSFEECRQLCTNTADCVQYAFSNGKCAVTDSPHWGEKNPTAESGWLLDRVEKFMTEMKPCEGEMWPTG